MKELVLNEEHMKFAKSYTAEESGQGDVKVNNIYPNAISMEVRSDLVDCEIAICTTEVLDHFTDNFDKSSLKDGFVNWLYESEIVEDRVRVFEVEQQGAYIARIHNPRMYGQVTQDILRRKAYPFVINKKSVAPGANYQYKMLNSYSDATCSIAISSHLSNGSVVGAEATIDHNSTVECSTIGPKCKIGRNV